MRSAPLQPSDQHIQRLLSRIGQLRPGTHNYLHYMAGRPEHKEKIALFRRLRQYCFPQQEFQKGAFFKATELDKILEVASQGEGYVIMWRHAEPTYKLYISTVPDASFWKKGFNPQE